MSFLIPCPHCGSRSVYEFRYGGEAKERPEPDASHQEWTQYNYLKVNVAGEQEEWWFHRDGCRSWFLAERNTVTNQVNRTWWPESDPAVKVPDSL